MFEHPFDQAQGLQALERPTPTRVVPVVATGPGDTLSLALLWALERGLQAQGQCVAVVEGLHGLTPSDAARGHPAVLQRWLAEVPRGAVVLLHAPLEPLAVLLAESRARPLVPMGLHPRSVVQAYNAVKVLVQAGGLWPVVVPDLTDAGGALTPSEAQRMLAEGCQRGLGSVPPLWPLEYHESRAVHGRVNPDGCLLKVLDSACLLPPVPTVSDDGHAFEHRTQRAAQKIFGVADVHRERHA